MQDEESLFLFSAIVQSSEDAIISKNLQSIITSWNRAAERMYGYKAHEAIGKPITLIIPKELRSEEVEIIAKVKKGIPIEHYETIRVRKDGKKIPVSLSISPIKNKQGKIIGAAKIARDISDRKQIEHNLQFLSEANKILASSLDYKTTLQNVARLAVPHIADWCTIHMLENELLKVVIIAHKTPAKVKWAKEINKQYPPDMNASTGLANVLRTGKSEFYPYISDEMLVASAKDENHLALLRNLGFISVIMVPITIKNKPVGVISFITTKTQRQYTKDDLAMSEELAARAGLAIENARLYTQSQHALALRDEFISVASHELKTPVTSLKIYTQGLQRHFERRAEEGVITHLAKMDKQINKLTLLISDLLNVSRAQFGKLAFHEESFDFNSLVKEIVENIQQTTKTHILIVEGTIKKNVWGDRDRIGQVLLNFITNAIKYSPGEDNVFIRLMSEKDAAVVTVQDFGIGIEKQHLNKIFTRFYRVTDPNERTFPGLGIGLYISHEIIKHHGGSMNVTSMKGKGSKFSFTIPYKKK